MNIRQRVVFLAGLVVVLAVQGTSLATWYWADHYAGTTVPEIPHECSSAYCSIATGGNDCSTVGGYAKAEFRMWTYTVTNDDMPDEQGPWLASHDRRCANGCTATTSTINITTGQGQQVQFSAATSWSTSLSFTIVKDVLGLGSAYTETNSTTWSNNLYSQTQWPISCHGEKCKVTNYYLNFAVKQKTATGPVTKMHYYCNDGVGYILCGAHSDGTNTAIDKERVPYFDSTRVVTAQCPTGQPCHCDHGTCICK
jgi:hypothetical protein